MLHIKHFDIKLKVLLSNKLFLVPQNSMIQNNNNNNDRLTAFDPGQPG